MTEKERFLHAVRTVFAHEGGYVSDKNDPGGETKFGISKRSYPNLDIKHLTRQAAEQIYYADWWLKYSYDQLLSPVIATKVLDLSVNVGPGTAHTSLQWALHACGYRAVVVDGLIGPQTIGAANRADDSNLLVALRAESAGHYRNLADEDPNLEKYLKGWLNRAYS